MDTQPDTRQPDEPAPDEPGPLQSPEENALPKPPAGADDSRTATAFQPAPDGDGVTTPSSPETSAAPAGDDAPTAQLLTEKGTNPEIQTGGDDQDAAAGTSRSDGAYVHQDGSTLSSQRLRLVMPDSKPHSWWTAHRDAIWLMELILSGLFFLLALYFIYLWIFSAREKVYSPSRDGFVQALAALPPVRPEAEWRVHATPGRWRNIVVHHTATKTGSAESIDRYHREVNKWENGLGYHFIIGNGHGMPDGQVAMSRRWLEQLDGAHVRMKGSGKANSWAIGIALVGNFEEEVATPRQLAALQGLLAFLLQEYNIKNEEIVGHGQVSANHTACPGKLFFLDEVLKTL